MCATQQDCALDTCCARTQHSQAKTKSHAQTENKQRDVRTLEAEAVQLKEQLAKEEVDRFVQTLRRNF